MAPGAPHPRQIPTEVELAVLGGGINGAAVACLAASYGYHVALFEKGDFASGTSSKSSKLVHGGIRYLETGHFGLVRESLREREALLHAKPHLVRPLPFLLPSYTGDARPAWMLRSGLLLYDWLASISSLPRPQWLTANGALQRVPSLRRQGLRGAGAYFDAQVDDARLTLEEVLEAQGRGATCLNYCEVLGVTHREGYCEVVVQDTLSGSRGAVRARALIVTAGPWADIVRQRLTGVSDTLLRPTRGSHIVLREPLAGEAVVGAAPQDGRVFFALPWRGMGLVGTTDDDDRRSPDAVSPDGRDIDYLLAAARHYFPSKSLQREDVVSTFAGLRPLLADGVKNASAVSRDARLIREGRLVFVLGGKLTAYRALARQALEQSLPALGAPREARALLHPWGEPPVPPARRKEWALRLEALGIQPATASALAERHGCRTERLLQLIQDEPVLAEPLCPPHPELRGEVAFAILHESAHALEDVLLRRLTIGSRPDHHGEASAAAASVMARYLCWDERRQRAEMARYSAMRGFVRYSGRAESGSE